MLDAHHGQNSWAGVPLRSRLVDDVDAVGLDRPGSPVRDRWVPVCGAVSVLMLLGSPRQRAIHERSESPRDVVGYSCRQTLLDESDHQRPDQRGAALGDPDHFGGVDPQALHSRVPRSRSRSRAPRAPRPTLAPRSPRTPSTCRPGRRRSAAASRPRPRSRSAVRRAGRRHLPAARGRRLAGDRPQPGRPGVGQVDEPRALQGRRPLSWARFRWSRMSTGCPSSTSSRRLPLALVSTASRTPAAAAVRTRVRDGGGPVPLVEVGPAEVQQHAVPIRLPAQPHRPDLAAVALRDRRPEPRQPRHRERRERLAERVGGGPPAGAEHHERVVPVGPVSSASRAAAAVASSYPSGAGTPPPSHPTPVSTPPARVLRWSPMTISRSVATGCAPRCTRRS